MPPARPSPHRASRTLTAWLSCALAWACLCAPRAAAAQAEAAPKASAASAAAPAPPLALRPDELQLSAAQVASSKQVELRAQLRELQHERASITPLWPLLLLGTGVAALLGGTLVAAGQSLACDHLHCATPHWTALAVVVGAGVGAVGAVWLVRQNFSRSQLDMRRDQLQDELERASFHAALAHGARAAAAPLQLRLRF